MFIMRLGMKRLALNLAVGIIVLVLVLYVHTPISLIRHYREADRQRHEHLESMINILQNCSCYMNYIRNHTSDGRKSTPETKSNVSTQNTTLNETTKSTSRPTEDALQEPNATKNVNPKQSLPIPPPDANESKRVANYLQEPVDTHLFSYMHNPEKICFHENGTKMDVYLTFFIPSAPGHFDLRQAVRQSYGNEDTWPVVDGGRVVTVFLLAATDDKTIQERIDREANDYGDIVQESFHDSYLNLTRKTIMGLKWVSNHCRHAIYAMKIDDDTTVIQTRIIQILENAPRAKYMHGYVFKKPVVDRIKKSKFYITKEYYPDNYFPAYPKGAGYIMTTDVVEAAFNVAITIPMFPWEDVFVGMCLHKIDADLHHDVGFMFWAPYKQLLAPDGDKKVKNSAIVTAVSKDDMCRLYEKFRIKR